MPKKKLGETLEERGQLSPQVLLRAIQDQAGGATLLGELLLQQGLVSKPDLIAALEEIDQVAYLDPASVSVTPDAAKLIPKGTAFRHCALPVSVDRNKLIVIMKKPQDLQILQELAFISGMHIEPRFAFHQEIQTALLKHYGQGSVELDAASIPTVEFFTMTANQRQTDAIEEFQAELKGKPTAAVSLVSTMIAEATAKQASDLHIDPQIHGSLARIRVDGILQDLLEIPIGLQESVVSRIKILADMDIAERRAPQDGRILVAIGSEKRDLRVSTLPTQHGEKVVIRLLDTQAAVIGFHGLGLWEEHADALADLLRSPQGLILVTGPTGSGKTTTLYAALNHLRSRKLNLMTVEDPVEYRLEGVNQVQVNEKAGRTFASTLRSMLRQDPSVIMVGEIRDAETAETVIRVAQTGLLVLSTLHTRDSASAVARLLDLGVPSYLLASTLTAVIAQRLLRKLCACRTEAKASREYLAAVNAAGIPHNQEKMFVPVGCPDCHESGYRGRVGVYEMLIFSDELNEAVRSGVGILELKRMAHAKGMRTLQEDALLKVSMGFTSFEEAQRVVSFKSHDASLERSGILS